MKKDYFKLDSTNTLKEDLNVLLEIIKQYSNRINVFNNGDKWIYFSIEDIKYFGDYLNKISNFAYYHNMINISNKDFDKLVCDYDNINDNFGV